MERPNIGILLSKDCLLWTEHGLLTPEELNPGDNLICLDSKSNLSKFPLSEKPVNCGDTRLVSISTKCNDTVIGGDTSVFTSDGMIKAKDVGKGTMLEMLSEPKCHEIKKICVPKENQTKIDGFTVDEQLSLYLAIGKPKYGNKVVFTSNIHKHSVPELEELLGNILPQLEKKTHGRLSRLVNGSWVLTSDIFSELCQRIDFRQDDLWWLTRANLAIPFQKSTLKIPRFLRDNGYKTMESFFAGIIAFRCRVSQNTKLVSVQTPKKLRVIRAFIQNIAWVSGLNIFKKFVKQNGNYTVEFKADDYDGSIRRSNDFAPVKEATMEGNESYCIEVPTNWSPLVDNLPVRANKINYEN